MRIITATLAVFTLALLAVSPAHATEPTSTTTTTASTTTTTAAPATTTTLTKPDEEPTTTTTVEVDDTSTEAPVAVTAMPNYTG